MPTDRMLPDTITLYNYCGEDSSGNARYLPTTIQRVYARMTQGIVVGRGETNITLEPQDALIVYVFDQSSVCAKTFLPFKEWDASDSKADHWTVHDDGSDLIVVGTPSPTESGSPPDNVQSFKATKNIRRHAGRPRMWHWEVHCA